MSNLNEYCQEIVRRKRKVNRSHEVEVGLVVVLQEQELLKNTFSMPISIETFEGKRPLR